MLTQLDKDAVKTFLNICKREINKGNCYFVGNRTLNINGKRISAKQALIDIGIMNIKQIWDYVLSLTEDDCIKVTFDYDLTRDDNSEVFIFKKIINDILVYIKLTIRQRGVICISFHEDY